MHTCLDQYHSDKATNGNGGLKWIMKLSQLLSVAPHRVPDECDHQPESEQYDQKKGEHERAHIPQGDTPTTSVLSAIAGQSGA
jgi:hypothetical protein